MLQWHWRNFLLSHVRYLCLSKVNMLVLSRRVCILCTDNATFASISLKDCENIPLNFQYNTFFSIYVKSVEMPCLVSSSFDIWFVFFFSFKFYLGILLQSLCLLLSFLLLVSPSLTRPQHLLSTSQYCSPNPLLISTRSFL